MDRSIDALMLFKTSKLFYLLFKLRKFAATSLKISMASLELNADHDICC